MCGTDPDGPFWQRAQQGDERAYDQLRRKYSPLVNAEIRKRLYDLDDDDLQDLAQSVWTAVWTSLSHFRGDAAFSTWIVGIAKNVAFQSLRRKKTREQAVASLVHDMCSRGDAEREAVIHVALHEAVKKLAETEREVIHLRYFLQLTDDEVAARLQAPLGTVKSRIRAGLTKLRAMLQSAEGEFEI